MLRIDFSQVPDIEPLPAGVYTAIVANIEMRDSKSGPDPYLNWTFEIINPPEYRSRRVWLVTGLGVKALWKLRETLGAFGETDLTGQFDLNPSKYIGKTCQVVVTQEMYNGNIQNRVDYLLPYEGKEIR